VKYCCFISKAFTRKRKPGLVLNTSVYVNTALDFFTHWGLSSCWPSKSAKCMNMQCNLYTQMLF